MRTINKKAQIIKCYLNEMTPQLKISQFKDNLIVSTTLKYGETNKLPKDILSKYIKFEAPNATSLILDFNGSSIKDVYKGLDIISHKLIA